MPHHRHKKALQATLAEGDIRRHLIDLTLPMIWGMLAVISMSVVDAFFVGQLGTQSLAAMGFTFPILAVFHAISLGIGIGTTSAISRAIGAGDHHLIHGFAWASLLISFVVAICFTAMGHASIQPLFSFLGASAGVIPLIREYVEVWYIGSIFLMLLMVANSTLRAAGNTKVPSYVMIGAAAMNLLLAPLLIFGLWGFPRMELGGAALATSISYFFAMLEGFYLLWREGLLRFERIEGSMLLSGCRKVLHIGLPSIATNLLLPISSALTTWLIAHHGSAAVAGYGVASRFELLVMVPLMALTTTLNPFVGQNFGRGHKDRLHQALRMSYLFAFFYGLAIALFLWIFSGYFVAWFNDDRQVDYAANLFLHIIPLSYPALGIIMLSCAAANGIGQPLPAISLTIFRLFIIYLPLAFLGSALFGLSGIFLANFFANIVIGILSIFWLSRLIRRA